MNLLRARRDKLSQRDAGFTLVELVVAMLVIAIVLIAIITVQARALTTNADSQARQEATALGNEAMEELRATPWSYLQKGLYSGFEAAAATATGASDPFGSGATRTFPNGTPVNLVVAPAGVNNQNLADPWVPLFDQNGSNARVLTSPSGNGNTFIVRAYVTKESQSQDATVVAGAVGLVVVVSWTKKTDGTTSDTVMRSTAYSPADGNCGNLSTAPFLASCQAVFDASASSSSLVVSATATLADGSTSAPLLDGLDYYSLQMVTASTAARVSSVQFATSEGYATFGGVTYDDNLASTLPATSGGIKGYTSYSLTASNDPTCGATCLNPTNVGPLPGAISTTSLSKDTYIITARSDDTRLADVDVSMTQPCTTGLLGGILAAGTACSHPSIGVNGQDTGYADLSINGSGLRLTRVEHTSGNNSTDDAWAGKFSSTTTGSLVVGCSPVKGSGCVASGAQQVLGDVVIGKLLSGTWVEGATDGLVVIDGYSDTVKVQRGVDLTTTTGALTRSGSIKYWNGSGYTDVGINENSSTATGTLAAMNVPPTTWNAPGAVVTAETNILVTGSSSKTGGSTPCKDVNVCTVRATNGAITVTVSYSVVPTTGTPWILTVSTTINGSTASARFEEAPNG